MQHIIIAFFTGYLIALCNGAIIAYIMWRRIKDLEKYLLIKTDLPSYTILQNEKIPTDDNKDSEWEAKKELERAYRRVMMQDTVSDDDIKIFGIKEAG